MVVGDLLAVVIEEEEPSVEDEGWVRVGYSRAQIPEEYYQP